MALKFVVPDCVSLTSLARQLQDMNESTIGKNVCLQEFKQLRLMEFICLAIFSPKLHSHPCNKIGGIAQGIKNIHQASGHLEENGDVHVCYAMSGTFDLFSAYLFH